MVIELVYYHPILQPVYTGFDRFVKASFRHEHHQWISVRRSNDDRRDRKASVHTVHPPRLVEIIPRVQYRLSCPISQPLTR